MRPPGDAPNVVGDGIVDGVGYGILHEEGGDPSLVVASFQDGQELDVNASQAAATAETNL